MSNRVSVILPVYNTDAGFFIKALKSIIGQSYKNFELLVIDDGSKKYISEIILKIHDPRIIYHRFSSNQGIVAARNYGLEHASGDFIAFQDSDDWSMPLRFEKQVEIFKKNLNIGLVYSNVYVAGDDRENLHSSFSDDSIKKVEDYLVFKGDCICTSSVMIRKQVLDANAIRFQNKYEYAEDYAFWLSLVGKTNFFKLKDRLVCYRFHFSNLSHSKMHVQRSVSCHAQIDFINARFGLAIPFFYWQKLQNINSNSCSIDVLGESLNIIESIIKALKKEDLFSDCIRQIFRKKVKSIFYHTHGVQGQLYLLRYPFDRDLNLSIGWKIYCLISRCW